MHGPVNVKEKSPGFFVSVIVYAVEWGGRSCQWDTAVKDLSRQILS